jgi:hypothetical protein
LLNTGPAVDIDVQLFNKTSTRLPEAIFVAFETNPSAESNVVDNDRKQQWGISKLGGQTIDPHNVLLNGSQYQHGKVFLILFFAFFFLFRISFLFELLPSCKHLDLLSENLQHAPQLHIIYFRTDIYLTMFTVPKTVECFQFPHD